MNRMSYPRSRVQNAQRKRTRAYRFSGGNPAFPAQGFTAYFVISPVTGSLATVTREKLAIHELGASVGRQDHTTSPSE